MQLTFDMMMKMCNSKPELRAKEEMVDGNLVTIFSYMVSMTDTFDSELAQEFRGIVFCNETKKCICRPLPKFFNVGEKESTQHHLIDWCDAEFYIKHDGSMLTPVVINNKVFWKTKNTFYSDVAINAQMFYDRTVDNPEYAALYAEVASTTHTQIFEYVGPGNQIVLPYAEESLVFLGSRCIETGNYSPAQELKVVDVAYADVYEMEEVEGFVIWDGNQLVKAKSEWYMARHKITSDFNTKRIIAATLDNTIDDMLGTIAQLGMTLRHFQVCELRDEVVREKLDMLALVDRYWSITKNSGSTNRKEYALFINAHIPKEYRSIMFKLLDDKRIDEIIDKIVFTAVQYRYRQVIKGEEEEDS